MRGLRGAEVRRRVLAPRDDTGEPWESDVGVAEPGPTELRFPALDLSAPSEDDPPPDEPSDPAEYAFS